MKGHFALETDMNEWQPVLAALESGPIPVSAVVISREQIVDETTRQFRGGEAVKIEIRDPFAWSMDETARRNLEAKVKAARPDLPDADFHFLWRRPYDIQWSTAWLDALDKLFREWHRGRVAAEAFATAHNAIYVIHRRVSDDGEDWQPLVPALAAILDEARQHPEPPKALEPLPSTKVSVAEVIDILRGIANEEIVPHVIYPPQGWKTLFHTVGEFEAAGWRIEAFKRSEGMKYVQKATAPDGRTGDYDLFDAREGDPFCLLEDGEQDRLCDVLDGL
jgi:hypothetical protein